MHIPTIMPWFANFQNNKVGFFGPTFALVVAEQLKNNTWHPLEGLDSSLPKTFEELFKGLPNYTIITFGTMSGVEGGCVMFKHTIDAFSYGSFFNKFFGPCLIRRKPDETWEYQTTLGV